MRDVTTELKALRLHGMAGAWVDLKAQGGLGVDTASWLIEHLLQAEHTDRALRSISHQLSTAKFPVHRDLAGFDFMSSKVDRILIEQLSTLAFTETAQNVVLIGGPGTGKTHLATAMAIAVTVSEPGFTLWWIWSTCWKRKNGKVKRVVLPTPCSESTR